MAKSLWHFHQSRANCCMSSIPDENRNSQQCWFVTSQDHQNTTNNFSVDFLPYWLLLLLLKGSDVGFVHSRMWKPSSRDSTRTVAVFPQPEGPDSSKMQPCKVTTLWINPEIELCRRPSVRAMQVMLSTVSPDKSCSTLNKCHYLQYSKYLTLLVLNKVEQRQRPNYWNNPK